ncbi:MAG: cytotoxic translational repressor of toxin-antitoxin stability system [Bdellovibrionota bacterium]
MSWKVSIKRSAAKKAQKIQGRAQDALKLLWRELKEHGPHQPNWPNFGKLKGRKHEWHCHLNKGRPRYVVCWRLVKGNEHEEIEIFYAWTHEDAPY